MAACGAGESHCLWCGSQVKAGAAAHSIPFPSLHGTPAPPPLLFLPYFLKFLLTIAPQENTRDIVENEIFLSLDLLAIVVVFFVGMTGGARVVVVENSKSEV